MEESTIIYLDFTRLVNFSWSSLKNTIINNLENYDLDLKGDNYNLGMGTLKKTIVPFVSWGRMEIIKQFVREIH